MQSKRKKSLKKYSVRFAVNGLKYDYLFGGGVTGNLNPLFKNYTSTKDLEKSMNVFLAGCNGREWVAKEFVKMYLAGVSPWRNEGIYDETIKKYAPYTLESFYYAKKETEELIPYFKDFLLDSGAFTFMQNSKSVVNWEEYIEKYADFINRNEIKKYFELDIDKIVGYEKVIKYRERLFELTGVQPIPVWHTSRGMKDFLQMCDNYDYVAIGGIVSKEIPKDKYKALPVMIQEAHKRGAKIHGLGFTVLNELPKCHFDSVDSTSWTSGNRFGHIWHFNGKTMEKIDAPKGKKLADPRKVAVYNYGEWVKFQQYAEKHL